MEPSALVLPQDNHNQILVNNVHPPAWKNPEPAPVYNLVVIGAGTAELVTAAGAAGLGAKVALIERHLVGGDCLNVGCVHSKGIIRSAGPPMTSGSRANSGCPPSIHRKRTFRRTEKTIRNEPPYKTPLPLPGSSSIIAHFLLHT